MPRPHFTPGKDSVPTVQEAGWAPGPVWRCGKPLPHRDSIPGRPVRSQSLYRLSYPAHICTVYNFKIVYIRRDLCSIQSLWLCEQTGLVLLKWEQMPGIYVACIMLCGAVQCLCLRGRWAESS